MSLLVMDGFDVYSVSDDVDTLFRISFSGSGAAMDVGRFGGRALESVNTLADFTYSMAAASDEVTLGFSHRYTYAPAVAGSIMWQLRNSSTVVLQIGHDSTGHLLVGRTDLTTTLIGSSAAAKLAQSTWAGIQLEIVRHASAGELRAWINGVLEIDLTGVNTGSLDFTNVWWDPQGASFMDDFFLCDTATEHIEGDHRIQTCYALGDTAQKDFSRSTGSNNYALVDEAVFNGDTDYVFSSTLGHKDLYQFALAEVPDTIKAVQTHMVARKNDAQLRILRSNLKSGGSTALGQQVAMGGSYVHIQDMFTVDPATGLPWDGGFSVEAGPELVLPVVPLDPHTYWRVFITANDGDGSFTQIGKLELYEDGASRFDETAGGTFTSSSNFPALDANHAFDQNFDEGTNWVTASGSHLNSWIRAQLATPKDIREFMLHVPKNNLLRTPKDFRLEYSDDGVAWTTKFSVSGQTAWAPREVRYFRDPAYVPAYEGSPLGAHRYWAIYMNVKATGGGAGPFTANEMTLHSVPGGADITSGGTPIGTSVDSGFPAANAFDASDATLFASSSADWCRLGYDFGAGNAVEVAEAKIKSEGTSPNRTFQRGALQYSDDGVRWNTAFYIDSPAAWAGNETRTFTDPNYE
jgi:hypothetical protein